jgi:alkylation response protein AidB-like acyl-CoA dehydrogenase
MDFDFTDEQTQLRDAVRKWVDKAYPFTRRREALQAGGFAPAVWSALAELGLTGLYVPASYGGMDCGPIDGMVAMEELGRGLVREPLDQALITSAILAQYAHADLQNQYLPAIASGQSLVTLAYQERASRYHTHTCQAQAHSEAGGYRIHATKNLVPLGDVAQAYLVNAQLGTSMALFLVERSASGVQTRGYSTQDGSWAADIALHNSPAQLLSTAGDAALAHALDIGIANSCAQAVGVMDKTLEYTVAYLQTRQQFGAPLSSFQALRHRVADMKMQLELARSMSYYASLKLNTPAPERRQAMARAKYQLGTSMRFIGQQAIQLHGGIGVTDDYIVSHYFKKLTQLEISFGDSLHHLGEVAARMQPSAGVFA